MSVNKKIPDENEWSTSQSIGSLEEENENGKLQAFLADASSQQLLDIHDAHMEKNKRTQSVDEQATQVDEQLVENIQVKQEDEDDEVLFIGSRPCKQPVPFPLPVDNIRASKKRKRTVFRQGESKASSGSKANGRPRKYLYDGRESESDFVLSDLEDGWQLLQTEQQQQRDSRRKTSRWVCYSDIEEKMFLHWLVQGRSLNYVVKAFRGLRSRNGLYQKMASVRRQFDSVQVNISKDNHYEVVDSGPGNARIVGAPGPIPREDLHQFKIALFEMSNKPSLKQRISGDNQEDQSPLDVSEL